MKENMYNEIMQNLEKQLTKEEINDIKNRQMHLGIFTEPYLSYILNGKKTIESRFSKNKIAPYNQINNGDIVIIKKSSGNVVGYFTAKNVLCFDLSVTTIEKIKNEYGKALCVDDSFWQSKKNSNYATLIEIDNLVLLSPFTINKKGMQTWIKL